ncbi:MAG: acylneuraminate cytidylyltransferase family protein [Anaerolineaceae bacterium]|nr:acylneuraminate cytidylyltransferase family protein [Anaerolineaceae bacterium]
MGKTRIAALVPMRHHSQRVPGKNYRMLAGKPLYHHILDQLLACPTIDTIIIDTDSPTILAGLEKDYPGVIALERPEHLRADDIPMNEVLLYDTGSVEADFYLQTHSTNPLLSAGTISRAVDVFLENYPTFDSLFSVTRKQIRLWDQLTQPINHNPGILLQTQDLPPVYEENSCIYIFSRNTLLERRNRLGARPYMFEIQASEAWDIDEEIDFTIADTLMRQQLAQKD